ncbi:MAG: HD domain-containing protein [Salinivirgaceae bacterium]|nr:HD domain-containing protein [Salinivirgaceae bacterium]MDY0282258.1 HD domain-containing protein [Salinivirgaceae bacterium]
MQFELSHKIFNTVCQVADNKKLEAYVVGGFVRDLILKRDNKDIDFVVVGSGIELACDVARAMNPKIEVTQYKNYGTAMFRVGDMDFEFVGARKESYNRDSRNPIVEDGTLADDQNRRDFTINAMAISVNRATFGQLIDPFDGVGDIERKIIRTPLDPDITFSDDPLRMMRAIRFATQLGFQIEENAFESIKRNAERLTILSRERINDELNKIILTKRPSVGFKLLALTGLLKYVLPELDALRGVDIKEGRKHKDNFYHTIEVLDNISKTTGDLWLRWAALLHDIAKPVVKKYDSTLGWTFHGHEYLGSQWIPKLFKRLRMPTNAKMKYVQKLVGLHMRPIVLAQEIVTDSAIRRLLFEAGDDIDDLMLLCDADITSKNPDKVTRYLKNYQLVRRKLVEIEEKDRIRNFQPPVSGEQIMEHFNLPPCKAVGDLKDAIKDAILEGTIGNTFDEAWAYMLKTAETFGIERQT